VRYVFSIDYVYYDVVMLYLLPWQQSGETVTDVSTSVGYYGNMLYTVEGAGLRGRPARTWKEVN